MVFVKHVCLPNDSQFDIPHWTENVYIKWYKPKFNRGYLLVMNNIHNKFEDHRSMCSQIWLIGQGFELQYHCDLDLRLRNPKFDSGHLLVMTSHHTKLEDPCRGKDIHVSTIKQEEDIKCVG